MYIYDKARELANDIKNSDEYKTYKSLKETVYADAGTKDLIKQYKKLQFEAQAAVMTGKQPDSEIMDKLKKLNDVLSFNQNVTAFFSAEYRLQTLLRDIYKIIGDSCDFMTDFLGE